MKIWLLVLLAQLLILLLGFGLMGAAFVEVSILHAPAINLLLWTGLVALSGLAVSAAKRSIHRWLAGTTGLVLGSLLSLAASTSTGLYRRWRR